MSEWECEPILDIYVPRAFQWYKKHHKSLNFDPWNRSLKLMESTGTPSPKVGVALGVWMFTPSHSLTLSYIPESMWCDCRASSWPAPFQPLCLDSRASSWRATLQPLCLGRKPKARVATSTSTHNFLRSCILSRLHLLFWSFSNFKCVLPFLKRFWRSPCYSFFIVQTCYNSSLEPLDFLKIFVVFFIVTSKSCKTCIWTIFPESTPNDKFPFCLLTSPYLHFLLHLCPSIQFTTQIIE